MSHEEENGSGGAQQPALDQAIESGIDNLGRLRRDMRHAGMVDCADALDEAFVKCLRAYLDRRAVNRPNPPNTQDNDGGSGEHH
jgi:hypothetical protein